MNKHIKFILISLTAALSLICTAEVKAQVDTDYTPLTTVPGLFEANEPTNPVAVLKNLYGFAIGVGSVIGVVMIMYAGFEYMYVESISGKSDAKKRIGNVFLGLAVILGSYLLLRTINPALVNFNVNLPGGDGKVALLSIARNMSDAARPQTEEALTQSLRLRTEMADITKQIQELEGVIGTPDENPGEHDANVEKINELRASLQTKKVIDAQIRTAADVRHIAINLDEEIYNRAAGVTGRSEVNISSTQTRALNFLDEQLADLQKLDQANPEVKEAVKQVTARKEATAREFAHQARVLSALTQSEGLDASQKRTTGTTNINLIRTDTAIQATKLRDAGLITEARQLEERSQVRITALCNSGFCPK